MTHAAEAPAEGLALPELRLKPREGRRLGAGHLWVFSNEVDTDRTPLSGFAPGALCRVIGDRDHFLGYAYVNPHALICARILGRDARYPPGKPLLVHRLQVALALRDRLYPQPFYRLVHGESDGLPGVVLDRYGDVVVGQVGTAGMESLKAGIVAAVEQVIMPRAMVWKNDSGARELEGLPSYVEAAFGEVPDHVEVEENGVRFRVPMGSGQKTGWFYDQAANRAAFLKYVAGKRVLDVFSYLGAWGLSAARAGAAEVVCVDSSAPALELLQASADANGLAVATRRGDAFDVLAARVHQAPPRHPEGAGGLPQAQPARHAAAAARRHPRLVLVLAPPRAGRPDRRDPAGGAARRAVRADRGGRRSCARPPDPPGDPGNALPQGTHMPRGA
jgi:23S rRNA (cytosine1962-C5)-methyltransferase